MDSCAREVRIVVNGVVRKVISNVPVPTDPFATQGSLVRYEGEIALSEVLTGTADAWLVVEAGRPLMLAADLGGGLDNAKDGMPDTTDNNGDGVVDTADVKQGSKTGPVNSPPQPKRGEVGFDYGNIANGGFPNAFTNPFVLDRNGDVSTAPGVTGGN